MLYATWSRSAAAVVSTARLAPSSIAMITRVPHFMVTRAWVKAPPSNTSTAPRAKPIKPEVIAESFSKSSGRISPDAASGTPSEDTASTRTTSGTHSVKPVMSRSRSFGWKQGPTRFPSVILGCPPRVAVDPGQRPGSPGAPLEAGQPAHSDLCRFGRHRLLPVNRGGQDAVGPRNPLGQPGGGHGRNRLVRQRWLAGLRLARPGEVLVAGTEVVRLDGFEDGQHGAQFRGGCGRGWHRRAERQQCGIGGGDLRPFGKLRLC